MSGNAEKPCPGGTAPGPHLTRRELVVGGLAASAMVGGTGIGIVQTAMMSPDRAVRTEFVVNGTARSLELDPRSSLLDVLREQLGLTGMVEGMTIEQIRALPAFDRNANVRETEESAQVPVRAVR